MISQFTTASSVVHESDARKKNRYSNDAIFYLILIIIWFCLRRLPYSTANITNYTVYTGLFPILRSVHSYICSKSHPCIYSALDISGAVSHNKKNLSCQWVIYSEKCPLITRQIKVTSSKPYQTVNQNIVGYQFGQHAYLQYSHFCQPQKKPLNKITWLASL